MVTFSCKKSGSQFHLGYSSLFRLRCVIAKLADADFGRLYASIVDAYSLPLSERTKFLEERYYV